MLHTDRDYLQTREETMQAGDRKDFAHTDSFNREWAKVVAKAWADPDFRKQVEHDPRAVLRERGIEVPDDVKLVLTDGPPDVSVVHPIDIPVSAGVGVASVGPPGSAQQTSGWSACIGLPVTAQLCFSGAGQPGGGMPPGGAQQTSGWSACIGLPVTAQLCFSGAGQPGGGMPPGGAQQTSGWSA
ncbi:hypothetical protein [Sinorhizobium medicae]|uniref:hypothetical protein n=1 Tax=Sinorhizobium medicae TaxID=110321 RepID=UPI00119FFFF7|nr:hypothetical protein [Sinorhizobium medicae]